MSERIPMWGGMNYMPTPNYFPGAQPDPVYIPPPPPRGRWVWVPDYEPDCAACRNGGICMCVRPEHQPVCGLDPAGEEGSFVVVAIAPKFA